MSLFNKTLSELTITDSEFTKIAKYVYDNFGINLPPQKKGMLQSRLRKLVFEGDFSTFNEYFDYVVNDKTGDATSNLINAVSTNHTFFFREKDHFDFFNNVALPEITENLAVKNEKDVRIWSAGCSSGEEPYTLAMIMMNFFGPQYSMYDAGVLATDISTKVLKEAMRGSYPIDKTKLIPPAMKHKFFVSKGETLEVNSLLKKEIVFKRLNLMNATFPFKKPFHAIFCRNVMIYFDTETRKALVDKFYKNLIPGGYFFIGHSETLGRTNTQFEYVMPALYRKPFN